MAAKILAVVQVISTGHLVPNTIVIASSGTICEVNGKPDGEL